MHPRPFPDSRFRQSPTRAQTLGQTQSLTRFQGRELGPTPFPRLILENCPECDGLERLTLVTAGDNPKSHLVRPVALAGTPAECREKIERYRASGIALPIVTPRGGGPDPRQRVVDAIRACAP